VKGPPIRTLRERGSGDLERRTNLGGLDVAYEMDEMKTHQMLDDFNSTFAGGICGEGGRKTKLEIATNRVENRKMETYT
jgi:hypothetical protein